jgi:uncharacterized protein with HEPN domain
MASDVVKTLKIMKQYCLDIESASIRFGGSFNDFLKDEHYRHSVSMCLLQIGEQGNKLPAGLRDKTKDIVDWDMVRGMRNRLAHGYGDMSFRQIFDTAINDIPILKQFCEEQIKELKRVEASD